MTSTSTTPPSSLRRPSRRKMPDSERVVDMMAPQLVHWWRPAALMTCCGAPQSGHAPSMRLDEMNKLKRGPATSGTSRTKRKIPLTN
eukprot:scaffold9338_cov113-Isochrysis_galbana.AAC.5